MTPQLKQMTITAATTGQGIVNCENYNNITVYVRGSAALSAGTLIIEEAVDPGDTAAWSQIGSITLSTPFASAGGEYAYHLPAPSAYAYVKTRIGTTVVGGTITVEVRAN